MRQFSEQELEALEKLHLPLKDGSPGSPLKMGMSAESQMTPSKMGMSSGSESVTARRVDLDMLEKKAEEHSNSMANGHS